MSPQNHTAHPGKASPRRTFSESPSTDKPKKSLGENNVRTARSASLGKLWGRKRGQQSSDRILASSVPKDAWMKKDTPGDASYANPVLTSGRDSPDIDEEGEDVFSFEGSQSTHGLSLSGRKSARLVKQTSFSSQVSSASDSSQNAGSDGSTPSWGSLSLGVRSHSTKASSDLIGVSDQKNDILGSLPAKHGGLRLALSKLRNSKSRASTGELSSPAAEQILTPLDTKSSPSLGPSPSHSSPISNSSIDLPAHSSRGLSSIRLKPFNSPSQSRSSAEFCSSPARSPSKHSLISRSPSSVSKSNSFTMGPSSRRPSSAAGEPVKETHVMVRDYDPQTGNKIINKYMIVKELGRGCHGKVKLCVDMETGEEWALKIVQKKARPRFQSRLLSNRLAAADIEQNGKVPPSNPELEKIKREIAILKKCNHPHVVALKEVIDDPASEKIYLVLEYLAGGDIRWHDNSDPPRPILTIDDGRRIFRDVICGIEYLHYQGIVHRDIKPANLLWTGDGRVKISDFGVSVVVRPKFSHDDHEASEEQERSNELELAKTAGTPAFFAPEMCGMTDEDFGSNSSLFAVPGRPFNAFGTNPSDSQSSGTAPAESAGPGTPMKGLSNQSSFALSDTGALASGNRTSGTPMPMSRQTSSGDVTDQVQAELGQPQQASRIPVLNKQPSSKMGISAGTEPVREGEDDQSELVQSAVDVPLSPSSPPTPNPPPPPLQHLRIGKAIDIWAMGVTLYCFIFGQVPFMAETEFELFNVISKKTLEFPSHIRITDDLRDLFTKLLDKDPSTRITLEETKLHPWTTADLTPEEREAWLQQTDPTLQYGAPVQVTDEDVRGAVTIMSRIRDRIRKLSSSFHNLTAGLRRRTKSMPSVPSEAIEALVKKGKDQCAVNGAAQQDSTRPSTTGNRSKPLRGRRRSPLSGGESSSDYLDVHGKHVPSLFSPDIDMENGAVEHEPQQQEWFRWGVGGRGSQASGHEFPPEGSAFVPYGLRSPGASSDDMYMTSNEASEDEEDEGVKAERERLRQFALTYGQDEADDEDEGDEENGGGLEMKESGLARGTEVLVIDDREAGG
ncbi:CAMKK/ELM protein kinase [Spizellomyces punctatus DAOM BR117]|uniref:CAMKK/ELM protein kinase n=1 Tax=Spizellomyces punctatus (strain DAOM BR117) TaxID=645134 RepID=A0A0L0HCD3_SPIPD|nr:CAMKK/ELM protein kinase [Spizellomyces punctatus DAOM BR117]KNC98571.1 CAMKK/ELM protein kinase [Spizellomyces punctatus DAOM BR117]|eukprot:XP_016606611.1 CAMKK/ELM protein kinase [Spizellomyces punctatus DAOM BR117]